MNAECDMLLKGNDFKLFYVHHIMNRDSSSLFKMQASKMQAIISSKYCRCFSYHYPTHLLLTKPIRSYLNNTVSIGPKVVQKRHFLGSPTIKSKLQYQVLYWYQAKHIKHQASSILNPQKKECMIFMSN